MNNVFQSTYTLRIAWCEYKPGQVLIVYLKFMFKAKGVDWHFSKEDILLANEHLMITISSY